MITAKEANELAKKNLVDLIKIDSQITETAKSGKFTYIINNLNKKQKCFLVEYLKDLGYSTDVYYSQDKWNEYTREWDYKYKIIASW